MNKIIFASIAVILAIQIAILGIVLGSDKKLGGSTDDNWTVGGTLSVTGASTLSGATTLSGSSTASGLMTIGADIEVDSDFAVGTTTNTHVVTIQTATSTVYSTNASTTIFIFSGGTGLGGQVVLEDNDGAGCTRISTKDGTVYGTNITCPTY